MELKYCFLTGKILIFNFEFLNIKNIFIIAQKSKIFLKINENKHL